jgi:small-conductance mechanosensitive channel
MNVFEWIANNWILIVVPTAVFLAFLIIAFWVKKYVFLALNKWLSKTNWQGPEKITKTLEAPFLHWCLILGAYVATQISALSPEHKILAGKILASLFIVSIFWVVIIIAEKLIVFYLGKSRVTTVTTKWIVNILRLILIVTGILVLLDVWGAPTTPIILLIAAAVLVIILATRESLMNIFSGLDLARGDSVKIGDFIKLASGEQGYVANISWRNTTIKSLDDNIIIIPNSRFLQSIVTNYGRPLKQASEPFRFYTRLHLKELTGLRATNLIELDELLRQVPESSIYYHTHNFLEEHHYLTPEPANDFSLWVSDALNDEVLSEKLAGIDNFEFSNINALRSRISAVIEEYIDSHPNGNIAPEGREFYFIKSISIILPTSYTAHDLREFIEILRKVSLNTLYFHTFESRIRLQRGVNDFSKWLNDCLGEHDLANTIASLDPYNYTLDNLRTTIIELIEKRIK